jgi:CRP-like cAMP-binding protein
LSPEFAFPTLPALDPADQAALEAACSRRTFRRGEALYAQGDEAAPVLFPAVGVVRAIANLADGDGVLAGLVGPGGAIGLAPALTGRAASHAATALTEVLGFAIDGPRLRRLAAERPGLGLALTALLADEMAQAHDELACGAYHKIEARLARLLLRLPIGAEGLALTQDDLAQMLAVQRTTVTMLAHRLKAGGLIAYSRARLRIVDRGRLAKVACGCPVSAVGG